MKKTIVFVLLAMAVVVCFVAMKGKKQFNDGVYTGESQSRYTSEPYWGQVTLEIKDDSVKLVSFRIMDKEKNEVFGPDYERHFKDTPAYVEQCRNEVKGIKAYTEEFLKERSMEDVDAITGATWSYNLFKDAVNVTLKKAVNK